MSYQLTTRTRRLLADTVTPVGLYLRLRDQYTNCLLLESADYHGQQNAFSYLVCEPQGTIELRRGGELRQTLPGGQQTTEILAEPWQALARLREFAAAFVPDETATKFAFISTGLFGYIGYEAVQSFEDVALDPAKVPAGDIPLIRYGVYRYVIAFNHFRQELHLFEHGVVGQEPAETDGLGRLENLVRNPSVPNFGFGTVGEEQSNQTDAEFLARLTQGQAHCLRGDVFQIVLSRRFQQGF